jgi:hypothetical protein
VAGSYCASSFWTITTSVGIEILSIVPIVARKIVDLGQYLLVLVLFEDGQQEYLMNLPPFPPFFQTFSAPTHVSISKHIPIQDAFPYSPPLLQPDSQR